MTYLQGNTYSQGYVFGGTHINGKQISCDSGSLMVGEWRGEGWVVFHLPSPFPPPFRIFVVPMTSRFTVRGISNVITTCDFQVQDAKRQQQSSAGILMETHWETERSALFYKSGRRNRRLSSAPNWSWLGRTRRYGIFVGAGDDHVSWSTLFCDSHRYEDVVRLP